MISKLTQMRKSMSTSSESSTRRVVNLTLHAGDRLLFVSARDGFFTPGPGGRVFGLGA